MQVCSTVVLYAPLCTLTKTLFEVPERADSTNVYSPLNRL